MERKTIAGLLLVAVLATMSLTGLSALNFDSDDPGNVEEALGLYDTESSTRLYPAGDPIDTVVEQDEPHMRFVTYTDGSTEDIELLPELDTVVSSQSYYAEQPGEDGRRPHIKRTYDAALGVVDELVQRLDGTVMQTTIVSISTKAKVVTDFALDGETVLRRVAYTPPRCCNGDVIEREERYRDDESHALYYLNVLNADDTRTITEYDAQMNVIEELKWGRYESISGSSVKKWYPGGTQLRLSGSADYYVNTVNFYRIDGTLEAIVKLSPGYTAIEYYDATGTKVRLAQNWYRSDEKVGDVVNSTYQIYVAREYDESGNPTREQTFSNGAPRSEQVFNVTLDGVTFVRVDYDFVPEGTVKTVRYWLNEVKFPPFRLEEHTPADGLLVVPLSPESIRLQIQVDTDLPIPPPQSRMDR